MVSAVIGAVAAVTAIAAALTFGASLDHLLASPHEQGWNWNVLVGNPNDQTDRMAQVGPLLAHNRLVGSYSAIAIVAGASQGTAVVDGKEVDMLLAIDALKGSVYPPLLEGHAPRADNQIVLGTQTTDGAAPAHRPDGADRRHRRATDHLAHRRDHDLALCRRPLHQQHG